MAINEFTKESATILLEDHGIDIYQEHDSNEDDLNDEFIEEFDLAIYPAQNEGFNNLFLGEDMWWSVRIASNKIDRIKYVACYRARPVSGITHYAVVDRIEPHGDGKYRIIFDNKAIELPHVVRLGDTNANAMRPPRYTSLTKLLSASVVDDLFK